MPTASRSVRKNRRIKRDRTLAYRALRQLNFQFEQLRAYASNLRTQLEEKEAKPKLTITKVDEPEPTGV